MSRRPGGLALLMVAGVLGILALLAAVFVTMAQSERRASRQRIWGTQARLLALSGMEDGLARLEAGQDPEATTNRFGGEDWLLDGDQGPGSFDRQQEHYHPGVLDTDACPAAQALRPSFFTRDPLGRPELGATEGKLRGHTGILERGTASTYSLKVSCQGGFFVNGGDPAFPATEGYNGVLRRILGTLAEAVDREDGVNDGLPTDQTDGERLVDQRPSAGWAHWPQMRDLALSGSQAKLDALRPFLTLCAQTDRKVIRPNAPSGMAGSTYLTWADLRTGRAAQHEPGEGNFTGFSPPLRGAPDFERLPVTGGRIIGRAPVSLAWARTRRPALIALLGGLRGLFLDETTACNVNYSQVSGLQDAIGTLRPADIANTWSAADTCHGITQRILACTSDLSTWDQWNAFCDTLPMGGQRDLSQARRDLLKAAFNPNSDLNKFNPNPTLLRTVDKLDLEVYSTELSLLPATDMAQEFQSVGRVLGRDGKILAQHVLETSFGAPRQLRLTTQREFVCEDLGDPELPGDEGPARIPGQSGPPFITASFGLGKTWGHALGQPGLGTHGASLQSYPEPCLMGAAGLFQHPADWDGNLQLATVETQTDYYYGVSAPIQDLKMLARFATHPDLDVHDGPDGTLQPDTEQAAGTELGNRLFPPSPTDYRVGTLYPDGCYAERGRTPAYLDRGNANGFHGVMSFWIKPNYKSIPGGEAVYPPIRGRDYVHWTNLQGPARGYDSPDQQFNICNAVSYHFTLFGAPRQDQRCFAFFFEGGHEPSDVSEHQFMTPMLNASFRPRTWTVFSCFWDFRSATRDNGARLIIYAGAPSATNLANNDTYGGSFNPFGASDITADENGQPHKIYLGLTQDRVLLGQDLDGRCGSGADATFDEFAIYDFGGAGPDGVPAASAATLDSARVVADGRYAEGRYYKGGAYTRLGAPAAGSIHDAAAYFSPLLRLPTGTRIRRLAWTYYRPTTLPDDYLELELTSPDGTSYLDGTSDGSALSRSTKGPGWSLHRQEWKTHTLVPGPFRMHALFRRRAGSTTVDAATPILDSPALDDITLVYAPIGSPPVLTWTE